MNASPNELASDAKKTLRFAYFWIFAVTTVFAAALILSPVADSQAAISIAGTSILMPDLCQFKRIFARDCPGCGMTRSFIYVVRFQLASAWSIHPVGTLLAIFLAATIPHRAWQIRQLRRGCIVGSTNRSEVTIVVTLAVLAYVRWFWSLV
jgi:hypothetical protein